MSIQEQQEKAEDRANDKGRAKALVYRYISYRARSCNEVKQYLKKKCFSQNVVDYIIKYFTEYGFIDDRSFAEQWVKGRTNHKPMGARRLKQELMLKGVSREIIEESINGLTRDEEYLLARKLADKRLRTRKMNYRQFASFLQRRGFKSDIISALCREFNEFFG